MTTSAEMLVEHFWVSKLIQLPTVRAATEKDACALKAHQTMLVDPPDRGRQCEPERNVDRTTSSFSQSTTPPCALARTASRRSLIKCDQHQDCAVRMVSVLDTKEKQTKCFQHLGKLSRSKERYTTDRRPTGGKLGRTPRSPYCGADHRRHLQLQTTKNPTAPWRTLWLRRRDKSRLHNVKLLVCVGLFVAMWSGYGTSQTLQVANLAPDARSVFLI